MPVPTHFSTARISTYRICDGPGFVSGSGASGLGSRLSGGTPDGLLDSSWSSRRRSGRCSRRSNSAWTSVFDRASAIFGLGSRDGRPSLSACRETTVRIASVNSSIDRIARTAAASSWTVGSTWSSESSRGSWRARRSTTSITAFSNRAPARSNSGRSMKSSL